MIVSLMFKTPDVLEQIEDLVQHEEGDIAPLSVEEFNWIRSYIEYGEYITVLFDVEKRTIEIAKP